ERRLRLFEEGEKVRGVERALAVVGGRVALDPAALQQCGLDHVLQRLLRVHGGRAHAGTSISLRMSIWPVTAAEIRVWRYSRRRSICARSLWSRPSYPQRSRRSPAMIASCSSTGGSEVLNSRTSGM